MTSESNSSSKNTLFPLRIAPKAPWNVPNKHNSTFYLIFHAFFHPRFPSGIASPYTWPIFTTPGYHPSLYPLYTSLNSLFSPFRPWAAPYPRTPGQLSPDDFRVTPRYTSLKPKVALDMPFIKAGQTRRGHFLYFVSMWS